jgi:hypothetical protein
MASQLRESGQLSDIIAQRYAQQKNVINAAVNR